MKKVKTFLKTNIKIVVAFILGGLIIGTGVVYAATVISSNDVEYSNTTSGLNSTTVQGVIDEIYTKSKTRCPDGNICTKTWAKIGDYISMEPTSTSFTIDTTMTGDSSTKILNPSELNLWRVIRINSDGTVEMVSEYVSSTYIFFRGQTGYKNFVGYLNTIAHQYENLKYTINSRQIGYSNQTQYITDTSALTSTTIPQTSDTSSSNVTLETESKGLGDIGYETDIALVETAIGTLNANTVGGNPSSGYWIASRNYSYYPSDCDFKGRYYSIDQTKLVSAPLYRLFNGNDTGGAAIRPIVTLKSDIKVASGNGNSNSPYVLG